MESRQVVCFKARLWCFLIGYLTLIGSCFPLAVGIKGLSIDNNDGNSRPMPIFRKIERLRKPTDLTWRLLCLVTGFYGFVMGAFLSYGVHLRKRVYLTIWMAMELLALLVIGFVSVWGIVAGFQSNPTPMILLIPFFVLVLLITVFPFWVVKYHWDELGA